MTSVWVVRAGNRGQSEDFNFERGRATIGWEEIGDLSGCSSREAVRHLVDQAYPGDNPQRLAVYTGQLWAFRQGVQPGDLVVMPLKTKPGYLAFGRCTGGYAYDSAAPSDRRHFLAVDWQPESVSRAVLKDDLLAMVNGAMTVFSPSRNHAAARLEAVAAGGADPGVGVPTVASPSPSSADVAVADPPQVPTLDAIRDRVRARIVEDFGQHKLTHLVADVLTALGFVCEVSPAGPDQGIDIRAGRGPLGLDTPIIVEVKSEPTAVGAPVMRGLHSAMSKNNAPQGLLVAMGGITAPAKKEFESLRTIIQVWDAEALLDQLFATYPLLPDSTKAALPLKQVWVLDDDTEAYVAGMTEHNSVQQPLVDELVRLGWSYFRGKTLDRQLEQVFVESEVVDALVRLNPDVAEVPARASEVVKLLRNLTFQVDDEGLVETNREAMSWLRGLQTHKFVGADAFRPVRLIDFENPANNRFVVADEVSFGSPGNKARFDIVLFVNGLPLVVGETKTAFKQKVSWITAANEVADHYQTKFAPFFTTNVFSFATEGRELMYGATGARVEHWMTAGPTKDHPLLTDVLAAARWLLAPATVLKFLNSFTLFETPEDNSGSASLIKLIARYMQFEAVELMVGRAHEGQSRRGLIYHTQGSGKTLAMVFAAGQLLQDPALANPTVVLVADRVDLVRNAWDQFRTTHMPRLLAPATAKALQDTLGAADQRGLIFTTVHKFAGAASDLNTRGNIVVLVDEAHRTQEGNLGLTMRAALPNALFFAFTGTPIAKLDRNTFATFGDPADEKKTLHAYTSDQSIADGMTVPIHVDPRLVTFQLDKDAVDEAFKELTDAENLDEESAEVLVRRGSRVDVVFANPARMEAVCADIVDHYYSTIDPLGMKAQVVVFDRAACVAYHKQLTHLLQQRHLQGHPLDEAAVVMHVTNGKGEDEEWGQHRRSEAEEAELLRQFRTHGDPLKFLVVTSRLGTGFNAPIEAAMYLDKPMKDHTLFQTITRTNRTWRNPETGQEKRYGLVVDYVGLGSGFARAMAPANGDQDPRSVEVDALIDQFEAELDATMRWFAGIDHTVIASTTLLECQQRIAKEKDQDEFVASFLLLEGIWEACWPHLRLRAHTEAYRFLAKIYASIAPVGPRVDLVWTRLGAKTLDIVFEHMTDVKVTQSNAVVVADADTIRRLEEEGLLPGLEEVEHKTANEVLDTLYARLKKRLEGPNGNHPVFQSLAERLENLRQRTIAEAQQSIEWLREAFTLAKDVTAAEKAEDEAGVDGLNLLPDPNVFGLTQIFLEYSTPDMPVMIERVVEEVDSIVKEVTAGNAGWASTQKGDMAVRKGVRLVLKDKGLHTVPGLFDRAYEYIAEHY